MSRDCAKGSRPAWPTLWISRTVETTHSETLYQQVDINKRKTDMKHYEVWERERGMREEDGDWWIAQLAETLAGKSEDLSLIPGTH